MRQRCETPARADSTVIHCPVVEPEGADNETFWDLGDPEVARDRGQHRFADRRAANPPRREAAAVPLVKAPWVRQRARS